MSPAAHLAPARAFTLVEMLVVMVIAGTLAAIAIPYGLSVVAHSHDTAAATELQVTSRSAAANATAHSQTGGLFTLEGLTEVSAPTINPDGAGASPFVMADADALAGSNVPAPAWADAVHGRYDTLSADLPGSPDAAGWLAATHDGVVGNEPSLAPSHVSAAIRDGAVAAFAQRSASGACVWVRITRSGQTAGGQAARDVHGCTGSWALDAA